MGFYIRKAFKTGPIRLNLSKGGLGLSGGVTGARLGINTRGMYVHGGRHGLYYRNYLKQKKRPDNLTGKVPVNGRSKRQFDVVHLFRDTGVTYLNRSFELQKIARKEPSLPSSTILTSPIQVVLVTTILLFTLSLSENFRWLLIPSTVFMIASLIWLGAQIRWQKKSQQLLKIIIDKTELENQFYYHPLLSDHKLPQQWQKWINLHLHAVIGELAMRHDEIDTRKTIQELDDYVIVEKDIKHEIRASILGNIVDEVVEDHLLSSEEEQAIQQLLNDLNLPENLIVHELHRLEHYSRIRSEISRPLIEIDPNMPLVRGEIAYEIFDSARLINERVFKRFQRNNVKYHEVGYDVDTEGRLLITNRRLMIIERGTREYRLNRIADITADPESGIVEIVLSNRNSPVLITVKEPLVLAARLEKIIDEKVR